MAHPFIFWRRSSRYVRQHGFLHGGGIFRRILLGCATDLSADNNGVSAWVIVENFKRVTDGRADD